jgi:hypothetical protein
VKTQPPSDGELHAFWDNALGTSPDPNHAVIAGNALPAPNSTQAAKSDAKDWVDESFTDAQSSVYVNPIGAGDGPFTITAAYKDSAKKLAQQRVALAGARLANMLNSELK